MPTADSTDRTAGRETPAKPLAPEAKGGVFAAPGVPDSATPRPHGVASSGHAGDPFDSAVDFEPQITDWPDGHVDVYGQPKKHPSKLRGFARIEAWFEGVVSRRPILQRIFSRMFLPLAFHGGLVMKKLDPHTFTYVLPFRRFNRNWYNAMAGAALVANSEIASGMYLWGELGGSWTVICKKIGYRFLRPCFGPAIYKVHPVPGIKEKLEAGEEFNVELVLDILQQVSGHRRQPRVGRCEITFHCAPKGPDGNDGMLRRMSRRRRRRRDR